MPPATQKKATTTRPRTVRLDGEVSSSAPLNMKRFDPLSAFSKQSTPTPTTTPPVFNHRPQIKKGKEKAKEAPLVDDYLWVDRYEPTSEAELAVHVKKVESVRQWLNEAFEGGPSGKLSKYRRILAMTGPAGTGKTSTIRVLAREMGFEILEWRSSVSEGPPGEDGPYNDYEGLFTKFEAFLTRASTCNNLFSGSDTNLQLSPTRRLILFEDLPNILHLQTQTNFHRAMNSFVNALPSSPPTPLVIIVSDAGLRGEASDERRAEGRGWGKDKVEVVDIRTVLSKDLLTGPYVTEIAFNPIAPTLMRKALQAMLNTHFASASKSNSSNLAPSKEALDMVVESSNGDIRSAIMALQFSCVVPGKKGKKNATLILEATTRREQSLALFHLIGKVLYNKRKADPPSASATAKAIQKEKDLDNLLKDPKPLPAHLAHHERGASRVDVDTLYADSPIETSLFSLYIHQNYTQFCTELENCDGVADWLSWIDSSGGDAWYIANPHQFHLLTMGTLHSLPSPVLRRSQKTYKPEFFAFLQKEKDAADSVQRTRDWLTHDCINGEFGRRAGGWSRDDVILELGGILKARDSHSGHAMHPAPIHRLFSRLEFTRTGSSVRSQQLDETGLPIDETLEPDISVYVPSSASKTQDKETGGWLESDDIEDFP